MAASGVSALIQPLVGIQSRSVIPVGMGPSSLQVVVNQLSPIVKAVHSVENTLSSEPVQSIHAVILKINDTDPIQSVQVIENEIGDITPEFQSTDYDIFLDGSSIKGQVTMAGVNLAEDNVHNQIELQSLSKELFWNSDPAFSEGIPRIEVHLGARVIKFLLESRTGDKTTFSLWGRSASAQEDEPYREAIDVTLTEATSARTVAEAMLSIVNLDWQIIDWVLPIDFNFQGNPVAGVQRIARTVGAVVRSKDNGDILVRNRFPVRPADMQTATPDVEYDRVTNLLALGYEDERGTGHNAITILGLSPDVLLPELDLEEDSPLIGQTVHMRAYWPTGTIPAPIQTLVTHGFIVDAGDGEESLTEEVIFEKGEGSVDRPIKEIQAVSYIGYEGGPVEFTPYDQTVRLVGGGYAIANVLYKTAYTRYQMFDHFVSILLTTLSLEGVPGVSLLVKIPPGDSEAPSITDGYVTNNASAKERGTAWLDDNRYNRKKISIRVPYHADANDGNLAYIHNAEVDVTGIFHIKRASIAFQGPQIVQQLEVVKCLL